MKMKWELKLAQYACTHHLVWRHRADRGCQIIYVCIYSLWVLPTKHSIHSRCARKHGHTPIVHTSGNTSTQTHTHTQVPTTQSKDGQVWYISCYESINDKSMRYNLNLSTCNDGKNNMLLFSDWKLIFILFTTSFYIFIFSD